MTAHSDTTIGDCRIIHADCLDVLPTLEAESVDSVVTDPPYGLEFMSVAWDTFKDRPKGRERVPNTWDDHGSKEHPRQASQQAEVARKKNRAFQRFTEEWVTLAYRVLKPGGHMLVFGGTRTYHRMAAAVEDAGFEVRDQLQWITGSGFPKNHRMGRYSDQWDGWGTALKPANEPILLARKPLSERNVAANVLRWGTGAINVDGCRVGVGHGGSRDEEATAAKRYTTNGATNYAMTPGLRGGDAKGRYPANVIHDGSDEVLEAFAAYGDRTSGKPGIMRKGTNDGAAYGAGSRVPGTPMTGFGDTGTAARFFYSAKASKSDRAGSRHPTVKPVDLMAYLCRLITPPGGLVLDPFAGSGTTGMGALREGFQAALIEREAEYVADIHCRLQHVRGGDTPLFQAQQIDLEDLE